MGNYGFSGKNCLLQTYPNLELPFQTRNIVQETYQTNLLEKNIIIVKGFSWTNQNHVLMHLFAGHPGMSSSAKALALRPLRLHSETPSATPWADGGKKPAADAWIQKLLGAYLETLIFWGVQLGTKGRSLCDLSLRDLIQGTNSL